VVGYDGGQDVRDEERSVGRKKWVRKAEAPSKRGIAWPRWTGFRGMTLRDWLPIVGALLIPVVIAAGTWGITWQQGKIEDQRAQAERELAEQRAQDETLQTYLDQTSTLLLEHDLRDSQKGSEVRTLAQTRTLTLLDTIDMQRRRTVLRFMYEADLIERPDPVIRLEGANLQNMDLRRVNLSGGAFDITSTYGADRNAEFGGGAYLGTDLSGADLSGTNLKYGTLLGGDLEGANLRNANLYGCGFAPDFSNVSDSDMRPPIDKRTLVPPDAAHVTLTIPVRLELPKGTVVPNLQGVFFNGANLRWAGFLNADLSGADFISADLRHSWMVDANLRHTSFRNADLSHASLSFASMDSDTNFEGADLTGAYLYHVDGLDVEELAEQAKSLEGATMPNGQKYADWLKDKDRKEDG
jgi:uncharacterized protein YjbI with pentapeptide repeats